MPDYVHLFLVVPNTKHSIQVYYKYWEVPPGVEFFDKFFRNDYSLRWVEPLLFAIFDYQTFIFGFGKIVLVLQELIIFYVVPAESLLEDLMLLAYILTKLQLLGAIWSLTRISCYILLLKHDYFTLFLFLDWISQDICCAVPQGRHSWFRNYNSFYVDVSIWTRFRFTIT